MSRGVLVFSKRGTGASAAKIHDSRCPVVVKARGERSKEVIDDNVESEIADLVDRGYKVTTCACAK